MSSLEELQRDLALQVGCGDLTPEEGQAIWNEAVWNEELIAKRFEQSNIEN